MASSARIPVDEHFRAIKGKNGLEEALSRQWLETSNTLAAIQQRATDMVKGQHAERSVIRSHIVQRHKAAHGADATISTSPMWLGVTTGVDSLELTWSKAWRAKGSRQQNHTRVPMDTKSGHRRTTLLKDAHEDEEAAIWDHELEARDLRERWGDAMAIRRAVRSAMRKYLSEGTRRPVPD